MHYSRTELRSKRQHSAPDGEIVRLYCGLEDADDLQADLALALQSLL
jgi:cystathionine beta-lyase/cystathionine gamma-synthase